MPFGLMQNFENWGSSPETVLLLGPCPSHFTCCWFFTFLPSQLHLSRSSCWSPGPSKVLLKHL